MTSNIVKAFEFNNEIMYRRSSDGYWNATAMCKAAGKRWNNFSRNQQAKKIIKHLEDRLNETVIIVNQGGIPEEQGTWIHPELCSFFTQWLSINNVNLGMSRDEQEFKQLLHKTFKDLIDFDSQVEVDNYFLDFYSEKYNLVVEYDEKHHNRSTIKNYDEIREQYLINKLNCTVIRVKQGQEPEGINQIIKFIMGVK